MPWKWQVLHGLSESIKMKFLWVTLEWPIEQEHDAFGLAALQDVILLSGEISNN